MIPTHWPNPRWKLLVLGEIDAPRAVLIRPDGPVAWAMGQEQTRPGRLHTALKRWCGISRQRPGGDRAGETVCWPYH
ncbi:aromatic-ring hydroxylase C-terminal domain-containing protein [Microtetraspora malaysiensis]|uniref:Uncharacterized protein n=1 Tax=Microtetraspora malaysiensis TaxID=161358 RepID=A0ABW6T1T3_9ACTN